MDADGSNRTRLTTNPRGQVAWSPSWFPDGKRIVFTQTDAEKSLGPPEGELFVVNADGTGLKRIAADGGGAGPGKGNGMLPSVSPDGKRILYTFRDYSGEFEARLYIADADGKNARQFLKTWGIAGAWAPDGKKIAFLGGPDRSQVDLCLINADGTNLVRLVKHTKGVDLGF